MNLLDTSGNFTPELQNLCGAGLALLAGYVLAFFWVHASVADNENVRTWMGSRPVFVLLTAAGTALLAWWNIENAGPVHGFLWVLGCALGVLLTRRHLIRDYCGGAESLPKSRQSEYRSYVKRTMFQQGHSETEKSLAQRLKNMQRETARSALDAVEQLHLFIHTAHDNALEYTNEFRELLVAMVSQKVTLADYQDRIRKAHFAYLRDTLTGVIGVFETLLGSRGLWAAVRIYERGNPTGQYRTLLRRGKVNQDRDQHSVPILENVGLPRHLLEQYQKGRGIVILNDVRDSRVWCPTTNDARGDDRSIMAGPIMLKSREKVEMYMILYLNSPDKNLFKPEHEQFMRCCTDVLSMFFSMAISVVREGVKESRKLEEDAGRKGIAQAG